jgi:hypothetical protein
LVYCALLFSFDFYLTGSSIYVYMSDLVRRWIATLSVYLPDDGFLKAETCSKVLFEITNVFHYLLCCNGF